MQPWAAKRCDAIGCGKGTLGRAVDDTMDPYITSCAPFGIPRLMNHAGPFEVLQTPGRVLMLFETGNSIRQIWMDGRGHPEDLDPSWMGHAIGHWEGDTLVVDTIGMTDKSWLDTAGHPHSDALHIVERIRRVDHDTLENTQGLLAVQFFSRGASPDATVGGKAVRDCGLRHGTARPRK